MGGRGSPLNQVPGIYVYARTSVHDDGICSFLLNQTDKSTGCLCICRVDFIFSPFPLKPDCLVNQLVVCVWQVDMMLFPVSSNQNCMVNPQIACFGELSIHDPFTLTAR